MVEVQKNNLNLGELHQLPKEKVRIALVPQQVTYACRFFPKLWLTGLNFVDPGNKKLSNKSEIQKEPILSTRCGMLYHSFPAADALLQKIVRWEEYKQPIWYNSCKVD